jgi:NDP-sugar pyrophosphorylase family protein
MLLAAGLGTRLRPLSFGRPKPLFPVLNRPMLRFWLERLHAADVRLVVVNAFYLAPMVEEFVERAASDFPGMEIAVSRERAVLGTGGGLKQAACSFGDTLYVVNSDIYSEIPLDSLADAHSSRPGILATLAVLDRPRKATVSVGADDRILAFREREPVQGELGRLCGAGIMVLEPEALSGLPSGPSDVIAELGRMLTEGLEVQAFHLEPGAFWCDMGTPDDYYALNHRLARGGCFTEGARIDSETQGFIAAEPGAWIQEGASVRDSILWSGAVVEPGCVLSGMIVAGRAHSGSRLSGGVITGD